MDEKNKVGIMIKHIRKSKGITQAELSREGTRGHICTVRNLRKIESGQIEPNPYVLNQLLSGLGVSPTEFVKMLYGEKMVLFYNQLEVMRNLCFEGKFEQAEKELEELKDNELFDRRNPMIKQSLLLHEGIVLKGLHSDYHNCLEKLCQALYITCPKMFKKENKLDTDFIANNTLTQSEYQILMVIANTKGMLGSQNEKIEILTAMCSSLSNTKIDSETKYKLLPAIYFNLSNAFLDEGMHEQALKASEEGIDLCQEGKVFKIYNHLLWNKGAALHNMGDKTQAVEYIHKAYNGFLLHGRSIHTPEFLKKVAAEEYGIWLD